MSFMHGLKQSFRVIFMHFTMFSKVLLVGKIGA